MICDYCQKNEATNIMKQTVGGTTKTLHICDSCAHSMLFSNLFSNFSVNNLVSHSQDTHVSGGKKACPKCGTTLDDIMSTAKVGCDECYGIFAAELSRSIEKMHGKSSHAGKVPESASGMIKRKNMVRKYKEELEQLIAAQEFEQAAEIRDKIRELEKKEGGDNA